MSLVSREVQGILTLLVLGGIIVGLLFTFFGCSYNRITFEKGSVSLADTIRLEPGQGGDSSDTGASATEVGGGAGKLSPGGSNVVDGYLNMTFLFQQGGETPTTTTPTASANVQSPDSNASVGPVPEPPPVE